jgi:hypothetical protein
LTSSSSASWPKLAPSRSTWASTPCRSPGPCAPAIGRPGGARPRDVGDWSKPLRPIIGCGRSARVTRSTIANPSTCATGGRWFGVHPCGARQLVGHRESTLDGEARQRRVVLAHGHLERLDPMSGGGVQRRGPDVFLVDDRRHGEDVCVPGVAPGRQPCSRHGARPKATRGAAGPLNPTLRWLLAHFSDTPLVPQRANLPGVILRRSRRIRNSGVGGSFASLRMTTLGRIRPRRTRRSRARGATPVRCVLGSRREPGGRQ